MSICSIHQSNPLCSDVQGIIRPDRLSDALMLFDFLCQPSSLCVAGDQFLQVHQQNLPPADLPPDASLQVDETERAQEEVSSLVSLITASAALHIHPRLKCPLGDLTEPSLSTARHSLGEHL